MQAACVAAHVPAGGVGQATFGEPGRLEVIPIGRPVLKRGGWRGQACAQMGGCAD